MKHLLLATLTLLLCSACGNKPIVDTKGIDRVKYQQDLAECRTYADEVQVGKKAAGGAAAGAAVGAVLGAIWSDAGVGESAASGAVLGGAGGTSDGLSERDRVVKNCLRNRGYPVLN